MNETIDLIELKKYHFEVFRRLFGESENLDRMFLVLWKNRLQEEVLTKLVKGKSKYFDE